MAVTDDNNWRDETRDDVVIDAGVGQGGGQCGHDGSEGDAVIESLIVNFTLGDFVITCNSADLKATDGTHLKRAPA